MTKTRKALVAVGLVVLVSGTALAAPGPRLKVQGPDGATTPTDKFVVTDTGQVGSGTSTPAGAFHAVGSNYNTTQFVGQWSGTPTGANAKNGGAGFVGLHNNNDGGLPVAGDRLGYFLFGSLNGTSRLVGGGITVKAETDWVLGSKYATMMSFETAAGTAKATRMTITSSGNVGINTTTPTQRLEVAGGIRLNTALAKPTCSATTRGTLWFEQGTTDALWICAQANGTPIWKQVALP